MQRKTWAALVCTFAVSFIFTAGAAEDKSATANDANAAVRAEALRGVRATYSHPPRLPNGRADIRRLIKELLDVHANTYSYAIHAAATDWDDLQLLLPEAAKHGIRVWGSVVPPSESFPKSKLSAEPFKLDYQRWAVEFAKLSLRETNLVAWSIDDFVNNSKFYTPEYVKAMVTASREVNPKLAFVPCCYFKYLTPSLVAKYQPWLDGFLFPYRHESAGANLKDADLVVSEVEKLKAMTGPNFPIVVDVYATAHSRLGATTPEYVRQVMMAGEISADGVMVYCHQDPVTNSAKYQIVKELFTSWADKK